MSNEFLDKMKQVLDEDFNESTTENGAIGYRTTGKAILDFNFKIASYRNKSESEIISDFAKVFYEDKVLAMKFLFYIRDREEGLGERRLFRIIFRDLAIARPSFVRNLVPLIAEYGRWDDLLELFGTPLEDYTIKDVLCKQLGEDIDNYLEGKPISLLAKWLPSINASNITQVARAKKIIKYIADMNEKKYRKILAKLRKKIDVVEKKMCTDNWDKIKYENVPSRANLKYNNAFLRHDEERRREFLGQVQRGERQIHAGKLYPYDIVHKYCSEYGDLREDIDTTLEELWKAMPEKNIENTLVVADGSGSMTSHIGRTNVRAIEVANALAIYFAEHNKGEFKNKYITFSENPQIVSFAKCENLRDKIDTALAHDEVANTNIEAVFDLILSTAIMYDLKQEEMPKNILIISDMEFDSCVVAKTGHARYYNTTNVNEKLFNVFKKKYEEHGYKLPRLVFWNVNNRTGTIPLKENDLGVALVSGFSTNIAEMVMSDKLDPLQVLLDKLNTPRYQRIAEIL